MAAVPSDPAPRMEVSWEWFRWQYDDVRSWVGSLRSETRDEAIGRTHPTEPISNTDIEAIHSGLVPFRRGRHHETFDLAFEILRTPSNEVARVIELGLKTRRLSKEFTQAWGIFCWARGVVEAAYLTSTETDDLQSIRAGMGGRAATNVDEFRVYASVWIDRWMHDHDWQRRWPHAGGQLITRARKAFQKCILEISNGKREPPTGFEATWFEKFLSKNNTDAGGRTITTDFTQKLTRPEIKKWVGRYHEYSESLPPLDW